MNIIISGKIENLKRLFCLPKCTMLSTGKSGIESFYEQFLLFAKHEKSELDKYGFNYSLYIIH